MIKVVDNCLHEQIFKDLVSIGMQVDYRFQLFNGYEDADDTISFSSTYQIKEIAGEGTKIIENEPLASSVSEIVKSAVLNSGMPFNGIGRIRFIVLPKSDKTINTPHIDYHLEHKSGLIYLNDSDGETVFYNEKIDWGSINANNILDTFKQPVTVHKRIIPKQNRMVLFDGNRLHSSTNPLKSDYRMVLNFNYV